MCVEAISPVFSEGREIADAKGMGSEEPSEVNCNGHIAADQSSSQWRNEDQHNGNAQPSEEERNNEPPVYPVCNGSANVQELQAETEVGSAHGGGAARRFLPPGLEEEELEQSLNQEQVEDGYDCGYTSEGPLGNGQPGKGDASGKRHTRGSAEMAQQGRLSPDAGTSHLLALSFSLPLVLLCDRQTDSRIPAR